MLYEVEDFDDAVGQGSPSLLTSPPSPTARTDPCCSRRRNRPSPGRAGPGRVGRGHHRCWRSLRGRCAPRTAPPAATSRPAVVGGLAGPRSSRTSAPARRRHWRRWWPRPVCRPWTCPRYRTGDAALDAEVAALVDHLAPAHSPELVFEMIATALRFAQDGANRGDLEDRDRHAQGAASRVLGVRSHTERPGKRRSSDRRARSRRTRSTSRPAASPPPWPIGAGWS